MTIPIVRFRAAAIFAAVVAQTFVASVSAPPLLAQDEAAKAERERAEAIARADSIRATLVQPPADRGPAGDDFVRLPFRLLGAVVTVAAIPPVAAYALVKKLGLVTRLTALQADLVAADIHPGVGLIGSRSWPALLVRYDGLDPFFLEGGASLRGYTLVRGGLAFGDTLRGVEIAGTHHRMTQLHSWGVGMDTPSEQRSDYALTRRLAEVGAWTALAPHVRLRVDGGYEDDDVGRGSDGARIDLQDRAGAGSLFGLEETAYWRAGTELDLDWTTWRDVQVTGFRAAGRYDAFRGAGDTDSDFQRIRGDARAYLPVNARHVLAVRGLVEDHLGEGGDGVPFHRLATLGDDDGLRGFNSRRFRDRALLAAMVEWRYRVLLHPGDGTVRVDGFAFVDRGGVGPSLDDIDAFETTPGLGMRFITPGRSWAEAYVAWGGDGGARLHASLGASF